MKKDAHYWDVLKKDAEACHQLTRILTQKMDAKQQNPDFLTQLEAEFAKHNVKPSRFDAAIATENRRAAKNLKPSLPQCAQLRKKENAYLSILGGEILKIGQASPPALFTLSLADK